MSPPEPLRDPASLRRLLSPRSVAVVGVSAEPSGFGGRSISNLENFDGPVWAVNPKYAGPGAARPALLGDRRRPPRQRRLRALALPRTGMLAAVEACIAKGAGGVIAFASGYGETGLAERIAEEAQLRAVCRAPATCRWSASTASASSTMC